MTPTTTFDPMLTASSMSSSSDLMLSEARRRGRMATCSPDASTLTMPPRGPSMGMPHSSLTSNRVAMPRSARPLRRYSGWAAASCSANRRAYTPPASTSCGVGAGLDDPAGVDDEDDVGVHDGREPVRDRDGRAPARGGIQSRLHDALAHRVERAGRLVEDEHGRVLQQHAGDRDPLLLAAREPVAALADHGVVALGERRDGVVDVAPGAPPARAPRAWRRAWRTAGSRRSSRGRGRSPGSRCRSRR